MIKKLLDKHAKNFLLYVICGGIATLVDIASLYFFTDILEIYYLISVVLAFPLGVLTNYALNKYFNFRNFSSEHFQQLTKFTLVALGGLLLNVIIIYISVEFFGLWYIFSKCVAAGLVLFYSYLMHRYWTFNDKSDIFLPVQFLWNHKLLILLGLLLVFHYFVVSPLKTLPSPLYGGDYYYQLGQTNHVKYGGAPWNSATLPGALPGYFVLYSGIAGSMARIFNIDAIDASYFFSYIIIFLSAIVIFYAAKKIIVDDDIIASIAVLAFLTPASMPVVKYTVFGHLLVMPLFLLVLYFFVMNPDFKNSVLLGVMYGFAGLTHSIAFISSSFVLGFVFLYYCLLKRNWKSLSFYLVVFIVGVSIALVYWAKPLFVYHGQTSPFYMEWNNLNWSDSKIQFDMFIDVVKNIFNFSSVRSSLISVFTVLGIVGLFHSIIKKEKNVEFLLFLLICSPLIVFHYVLTQNLFNINFLPNYILYLLLSPVLLFVFAFGVFYACSFLKTNKRIVFLSVVLTVLLLSLTSSYSQTVNGPYYATAKNDFEPYLQSLQKYLVENTDVDDVILTTKELGFAVNAISGRKLVITRRAQNDPFIDMDPRELAAAIIFYGNDSSVKPDLLNEYNVDYFYVDTFWQRSEFDALMLFYSPENEALLKKYGIAYDRRETYVDPSMRGDQYKTFDLLVVAQRNYYSAGHPWNPNLDIYLQKVWSYSEDGAEMARLYRINKYAVPFALSSHKAIEFFKPGRLNI